MNPNITIEPLRSEDIGAVTDLINTLVPWNFSQAKAADAYAKIIADKNYAIFVAKENGQVVGTVTAICCQALAAKFLVIEDVIVAPTQRGQGIGRLLMQAADRFAVERNCTYAILVSSGHRTDAHRFYGKCGFGEDVRGFRKNYESF